MLNSNGLAFYAHYTLTLKVYHFGPQTSISTQFKTTPFLNNKIIFFSLKKKEGKIFFLKMEPPLGQNRVKGVARVAPICFLFSFSYYY
jgi:hypothetical protein